MSWRIGMGPSECRPCPASRKAARAASRAKVCAWGDLGSLRSVSANSILAGASSTESLCNSSRACGQNWRYPS